MQAPVFYKLQILERARMAKINSYLESHYRPTPRDYTFQSPQKAA
jgi:hypothetical protein